MPLVSASHLSMHFTGPLLLEDVTLAIEPGAKVGVIGRNGVGKSTLLKLLGGLLEPTDGGVVRQRGIRVDYQAQELQVTPGRSVFEEIAAVFLADADRERRLRFVEARLAEETDEAARARLLAEYERLAHEQDSRGVYDIDRRIETMLTSLGLPEETWGQPADSFSGGERNVIGLARVLLAEPDVMLLDEPSNHLDMEGVEWFIDFLRRSPAAVVMVSHNRHLLDATTSEIWEIRRRRVRSWTGNYSDFQRQKAEALALQERQFRTQQRLIARIEFQARRLMDMANAYDDPGQAKRAKAMLRRIDRLDKVDRPDTGEKMFRASLRGGSRHGRIALAVEGFDFAYGERTLLEAAALEIEFGERVCLVGPNGSGKTTLFREILEHGAWDNPTLRLGKSVKVGEYRQLHDVLDHEATVVEWVARDTGLTRSDASRLLYRFLFTQDDLERKIETLSGGEKSRLQLARLVHGKVNFLLLDEPTNHLDIQACEQFEEMLQEFQGTVFVISHDRYFLDKLVDRVVELEDRGLVDHRCNFAEWWRRKVEARERRRKGALAARESEQSDKQDRRKEYEERKARQREQDRARARIRDIEQRIAELETRSQELRRSLEEAYATEEGHRRAERLSKEFDGVRTELADLYNEWEALL